MEKKAEISVIMSVYRLRGKKCLLRAVQSIIEQSFQDWELILYGDGPDEMDAKIIWEAAKMDPRILYIHNQKNHGLGYGLNQCISHASGSYIARMDADDIAVKERLEMQYRFLQTHPKYQWVGSNAELIDRHGVWGLQKMPEIPRKSDFLFNLPYIHPTVMFRRKVLVNSGGYQTSKEILQVEDYELFMRLTACELRGYNLQIPLLKYWEDYSSYTNRTYARRVREMKVRYRGFRKLGILNKGTVFFVLKPLFVGAVPAPVHHYVRRKMKK